MNGIIVACGGALIAAFVSIVTLLLNRKWQKEDKKADQFGKILSEISSIKSALDNHIGEQDLADAKRARRRILEFADECRRGIKHSAEHFNNIMTEDVDLYEKYCKKHEEFENSKCVLSIDLIKELYQKTSKDNDFV